VHHGTIGSLTGIEAKLLKQAAYADPGALVTDADPDSPIFIVNAHDDHCVLEPRVADARHRQQKLPG
jgi:hypothetical protein